MQPAVKRKTVVYRESLTTYDRDGNVLNHWEREKSHFLMMHLDPDVFYPFLAAVTAGENILEIAERFQTNHCYVLYWKRKLGINKPWEPLQQ